MKKNFFLSASQLKHNQAQHRTPAAEYEKHTHTQSRSNTHVAAARKSGLWKAQNHWQSRQISQLSTWRRRILDPLWNSKASLYDKAKRYRGRSATRLYFWNFELLSRIQTAFQILALFITQTQESTHKTMLQELRKMMTSERKVENRRCTRWLGKLSWNFLLTFNLVRHVDVATSTVMHAAAAKQLVPRDAPPRCVLTAHVPNCFCDCVNFLNSNFRI